MRAPAVRARGVVPRPPLRRFQALFATFATAAAINSGPATAANDLCVAAAAATIAADIVAAIATAGASRELASHPTMLKREHLPPSR